MPLTIKLVVIGSSGVGKTSLRGKYISGRFSSGYRATIGADFITKTLPHPSDANQSITLQIWDTAGQERFSSLSTAFFRGADAALLMFDVNDPSTMRATKKWWADFCDKAPVADEDVGEYCCVLVGNKIDMVLEGGRWRVSESEALEFLDELVPPQTLEEEDQEETITVFPCEGPGSEVNPPEPQKPLPNPSKSPISIHRQNSRIAHSREPSHSPKHHLSKSRSRSSSRFYAGTVTSTQTALTIYHTPSSSVFDMRSIYQSARSSPEPWFHSEPDLQSPSISPSAKGRRRTQTMHSLESTGSESAATITPSRFARERQREQNTLNSAGSIPNGIGPASPNGLPSSHSSPDLSSLTHHHHHHHHHQQQPKYQPPIPPERGPRLFFTSAKTGEGVNDVFEYIARRVVRKWEYDEWVEARRMHFRDSSMSGGTTLTMMMGSSRGSDSVRLLGSRGNGGSGCC